MVHYFDDSRHSLCIPSLSMKRGQPFIIVSALALVCLVLPLVGAKLAGHPVIEYLRFPPVPYRMNYPALHKGALIGIIAFIVLFCLLWFISCGRGTKVEEDNPVDGHYTFPWWGWFGLGSGVVIWVLAWTRFKWFSPFQPYTFFPQWLSFILLMNALTHLRSGICPMLNNTAFFLRLFMACALFWWAFEYLNRFVNNWIYEGASCGTNPVGYILFATIAFSTVIPGVYSTKKFLGTFPGLRRFLERGPAVRLPTARGFHVCLLLGVSACFLFISWCPKVLYPILWIGPFVGWVALHRVIGIPLHLGGISRGDWSYLLGWGLAALTCGFFWEMWNYYSMSKWTYQVPYLHVFKVFEMPLAGYTGYPAFGLECAMAIEVTRRLSGSLGLKDA